MNVQLQNFQTYNQFSRYSPKTSNTNLINFSNVISFGDKFESSKSKDKKQPQEGKSGFAKTLEKISLSFFNWSEKISGKTSNETNNQQFDQAKIIRDLTLKLNQANGKIDKLEQKRSSDKEKINSQNNEIAELNHRIANYQKENIDLKLEVNASQRKLQQTIEAHEKGEINSAIREEILEEIENKELNYNPMSPFFQTHNDMYKPEQYSYVYKDIKIGTTNRENMKKLDIPQISLNGNFDFCLPDGEMKIKKAQLKEFNEPFDIQSNISEKYTDSLVWNNDKVSRDLLQNFFDGHGQTLDGVHFKFKNNGLFEKGKYKVRIEGKSIYNFKEAILLGESSSHDNKRAAGNYGEGLKMVTLKLLTQNKASDVKIGSGNWEITCSLKDDERLDSKLINYKVNPVENYDGNFIEFETSDKDLIKSIRNTINRFYHSSNHHFECPDFENDLFGIKILPRNEQGGLYIAGQRFELEKNYDSKENVAVFIKEKVPTKVFDVSRDRISISNTDFLSIAGWLASKCSTEEQMQIIKCTEDFVKSHNIAQKLNYEFTTKLGDKIRSQGKGAIEFPDNYVAKPSLFYNWEMESDMEKNGYKLFPCEYEALGMKSMVDTVSKAKQHIALEPKKNEKMKINLLKKALKDLSNLTKEHFTTDEIDTKIYLFNANSQKENSILKYKDALAEAILDNDQSKGFWLDKTYLKKASFAKVLETALHELSHKAGGDGDSDFSYKLTRVNKVALEQIINDPKIAQKFRIYSDIWNSLN